MSESEWNNTVIAGGGDFLQSKEWGSFQKKLGHRVERIEEGGLISQMIFRPLALGRTIGYIPMGPLPTGVDADGPAHLIALEGHTDSGTVFIDCDLLKEITGFEPITPNTRQPLRVQRIPIEGMDLESLVKSFHPTLRQNLERAQRYQLLVKKENGWEGFYELYVQTMKRHKLRPWHEHYIKTLWQTLSVSGNAEIWSAYEGNDLLASSLYILFGGRATHLFAGSSSQKRDAMAPHFLHWQMMSIYSSRGLTEYDLGKVDEKLLPGLSSFKERFGGAVYSYPGNFRRVIKPAWYFVYSLVR